jgi:hypothetical protein
VRDIAPILKHLHPTRQEFLAITLVRHRFL